MKEIKGFRPEGPEEEKSSKAPPKIHRADETSEVKGFTRPLSEADLAAVREKAKRAEARNLETITNELQFFINKLCEFPPVIAQMIRRELTGGGKNYVVEELPERLGRVLSDIEKMSEDSEKDRKLKTGLKELCSGFKEYLDDLLAGKLEHKEITGFTPEEPSQAA